MTLPFIVQAQNSLTKAEWERTFLVFQKYARGGYKKAPEIVEIVRLFYTRGVGSSGVMEASITGRVWAPYRALGAGNLEDSIKGPFLGNAVFGEKSSFVTYAMEDTEIGKNTPLVWALGTVGKGFRFSGLGYTLLAMAKNGKLRNLLLGAGFAEAQFPEIAQTIASFEKKAYKGNPFISYPIDKSSFKRDQNTPLQASLGRQKSSQPLW